MHWRGHSLYPHTSADGDQYVLSEGELYMCVNPNDPALVFKDESGRYVTIRPTNGGGTATEVPEGTLVDDGNRTVEELNNAIDIRLGSVYNVTNDGVLEKTVEGNFTKVHAGDNVMWTSNGWDIISGTTCPGQTFEGKTTESVGRITANTDLDGMSAIEILQLMLKGHTQISIESVVSNSILKVDKRSTLTMQITTKNCVDGDKTPHITAKVEGSLIAGLTPYQLNQALITGSNIYWNASDNIQAGTTKDVKEVKYSFVATSSCDDEKSSEKTISFTPHYPVIMLNSDKSSLTNDDVDLISNTFTQVKLNTDDAARKILGGDWRIPTKDEWNELITKCNIQYIANYNNSGIDCSLITGPNNNSILLPFIKAKEDNCVFGILCYYASSSLTPEEHTDGGFPHYTEILSIDNSDPTHIKYSMDMAMRYYGRPVRPVSETDGVDLGLSVRWASTNLSVFGLCNSVTDEGDSFAFGETEPKATYTMANYKFYNSALYKYDKYNDTDNLTTLMISYDIIKDDEECDDAARKILGGDWHIPYPTDWEELKQYGTFTLMLDYHGKSGYLYTSNVNNKSVFFPFGVFEDYLLSSYYWSNTAGDLGTAWMMGFEYYLDNEMQDVGIFTDNRCFPLQIRPVSYKNGVDLGLPSGVRWASSDLTATGLVENEYDYGEFFAWGETEPKVLTSDTDSYFFDENYWYDQYKYTCVDYDTFEEYLSYDKTYHGSYYGSRFYSKYNHKDQQMILTPNQLPFNTEDEECTDAAYAILKDGWRIPSSLDWSELSFYCSSKEETIYDKQGNAHNGCRITSKLNNRSIFLPAVLPIIGDKVPPMYDQTSVYQTSNAITNPLKHSKTLITKTYIIPYLVTISNNYVGVTLDLDNCEYASQTGVTDLRYIGYNDGHVLSRIIGTGVRPVNYKGEGGVDLGLPSGIRWASSNLTATGLAENEYEIGDRFAWGEIKPKETFTIYNYKYYDQVQDTFTKYFLVNDNQNTLYYNKDLYLNIPDSNTGDKNTIFHVYMSEKPHTLEDSKKLEFTTQNGCYTYLLVPKIWDVGQTNLLAGNSAELTFMPCTDLNLPDTIATDIDVVLNDGNTYEYQYYRTATKQQKFTYNFRF